MDIQVREAAAADLDDVLAVEQAAFGGSEEAELVRVLLRDSTAMPALSLLAWAGDRAVGHILFTTAQLAGTQDNISISLLAPLAVVPDAQRQGVGTRLVEIGCQRLSQAGIGLVFVLGYPKYYSRQGFRPAQVLGFETPQPILEEQASAWMVRALRPGLVGYASGRVVCADALNKPELWRE